MEQIEHAEIQVIGDFDLLVYLKFYFIYIGLMRLFTGIYYVMGFVPLLENRTRNGTKLRRVNRAKKRFFSTLVRPGSSFLMFKRMEIGI